MRVIIYHRASGKVEENMGPLSPRSADKVERGASINLNHKDYAVRQVPDDFKAAVYKPKGGA